MSDGYESNSNSAVPSQLDIFLAEYVDGTMDPIVREAFEELMRREPEVAEQASCLEGVRLELCQLNCQCSAPDGFEARLRRQLAYEMLHEGNPVFTDLASRLRLVTTLASVVLLLMVGGASYTLMVDTEGSLQVTSTERPNLPAHQAQALGTSLFDQPAGPSMVIPASDPGAWLNRALSEAWMNTPALRSGTVLQATAETQVYRHKLPHLQPVADSLAEALRGLDISPLP